MPAVRAHQTCLLLRLEHLRDVQHVVLRNTLGDGHSQRNLGLDGLADRLCRNGWGHEDPGRGRAGLLHGLGHSREHGLAQVRLPGLLGVGAAHDVGAVLLRQLRVERGLLARESLDDHLSILSETQVPDCLVVWHSLPREASAGEPPAGGCSEHGGGGGGSVCTGYLVILQSESLEQLKSIATAL